MSIHHAGKNVNKGRKNLCLFFFTVFKRPYIQLNGLVIVH